MKPNRWCWRHGFTSRNKSSRREWRQLPGQWRWFGWMWNSQPTEVVPQNVAATSYRGKRSERGTPKLSKINEDKMFDIGNQLFIFLFTQNRGFVR